MLHFRLYFAVMLVFVASLSLASEKYRILFLNTSSIHIGKVDCKVGDVFYADSRIVWCAEKQAMKVLSLSDNRQVVITSKQYQEKKSKSLLSYLSATKSLSTRPGLPLSLVDLKRYLSGEFKMLDFIEIPINIELDDNHFFYLSYQHEGESINKRINTKDNSLIIDHSLWTIDGVKTDPCVTNVWVHYYDADKEMDTIVSASMKIVPLPLSIE